MNSIKLTPLQKEQIRLSEGEPFSDIWESYIKLRAFCFKCTERICGDCPIGVLLYLWGESVSEILSEKKIIFLKLWKSIEEKGKFKLQIQSAYPVPVLRKRKGDKEKRTYCSLCGKDRYLTSIVGGVCLYCYDNYIPEYKGLHILYHKKKIAGKEGV